MASVKPDGLAAGTLRAADIVMKINGNPLDGMSMDQIIKLMASSGNSLMVWHRTAARAVRGDEAVLVDDGGAGLVYLVAARECWAPPVVVVVFWVALKVCLFIFTTKYLCETIYSSLVIYSGGSIF